MSTNTIIEFKRNGLFKNQENISCTNLRFPARGPASMSFKLWGADLHVKHEQCEKYSSILQYLDAQELINLPHDCNNDKIYQSPFYNPQVISAKETEIRNTSIKYKNM